MWSPSTGLVRCYVVNQALSRGLGVDCQRESSPSASLPEGTSLKVQDDVLSESSATLTLGLLQGCP
jgi:hypothetical protein